MRPINRIRPQGPVHAYKTFEIIRPIDTHFQEATCGEVECGNQANGFVIPVDEGTELGQQQAHYIRNLSGRGFFESHGPDGQTWFKFPPGEECFEQHRVAIGREAVHIVRGGDWRGQVGRRHVYDRGEQWVSDFATHQERLKKAVEG